MITSILSGVILATVFSVAHAADCPDLKIQIQNRTDNEIVGGIEGRSGNLGSGGWYVGPQSIQEFKLPSQNYPQGEIFKLFAKIDLIKNPSDVYWNRVENNAMTSVATVAGVDGCPNPDTHVDLFILQEGENIYCSFRAR